MIGNVVVMGQLYWGEYLIDFGVTVLSLLLQIDTAEMRIRIA